MGWNYLETAMGKIAIEEQGGAIVQLAFVKPGEKIAPAAAATPLLKRACRQLEEYFAAKRQRFDLPLAPIGTPFQLRVWSVLETIPYGETWSYKDVATAIGNPKATRAVGMANNRNPIAVVIPCHRVIGANGALVGYGGGLHLKEQLLALERSGSNNLAKRR